MDNLREIRLSATASTIAIARGNLARIDNARGVKLRVEQGFLWVTQDGSIADICLDAGDSFTVERDGPTILSACGNFPVALVALEGPAAPAPAPTPGESLRQWCHDLLAPWSSRPATAAH